MERTTAIHNNCFVDNIRTRNDVHFFDDRRNASAEREKVKRCCQAGRAQVDASCPCETFWVRTEDKQGQAPRPGGTEADPSRLVAVPFCLSVISFSL